MSGWEEQALSPCPPPSRAPTVVLTVPGQGRAKVTRGPLSGDTSQKGPGSERQPRRPHLHCLRRNPGGARPRPCAQRTAVKAANCSAHRLPPHAPAPAAGQGVLSLGQTQRFLCGVGEGLRGAPSCGNGWWSCPSCKRLLFPRHLHNLGSSPESVVPSCCTSSHTPWITGLSSHRGTLAPRGPGAWLGRSAAKEPR